MSVPVAKTISFVPPKRHMQEFEQSHQIATKQMGNLESQKESHSQKIESLLREQGKMKKHMIKSQKEIQVRCHAIRYPLGYPFLTPSSRKHASLTSFSRAT